MRNDSICLSRRIGPTRHVPRGLLFRGSGETQLLVSILRCSSVGTTDGYFAPTSTTQRCTPPLRPAPTKIEECRRETAELIARGTLTTLPEAPTRAWAAPITTRTRMGATTTVRWWSLVCPLPCAACAPGLLIAPCPSHPPPDSLLTAPVFFSSQLFSQQQRVDVLQSWFVRSRGGDLHCSFFLGVLVSRLFVLRIIWREEVGGQTARAVPERRQVVGVWGYSLDVASRQVKTWPVASKNKIESVRNLLLQQAHG